MPEPPARAPRETPDADARAWYLRAAAAEGRGDLEEAERAWLWVLRLDRGYSARVGRGRFLARSGRRDEARAVLEEALALAPERPEAHLGLARLLVAEGDDRGARPHLEAAADSGEPAASHLLGRLLLRLGEPEEAVRVHAAWTARPATGAEAFDRALLGLAVDRPGPALDDLLTAMEEGYGVSAGAGLLGDAARRSCRAGTAWRWAKRHRIELREDQSWRAVTVAVGRAARDPELVDAGLGSEAGLAGDLLRERVDLRLHAGRADQAVELLRQARAVHPDPLWLAVDLGRALRSAGRKDEALAAFAEVPLDHPHGPTAARERADLLLAQLRPAEALVVADAAVRAAPDVAPLAAVRARALQASGAPEAAEAALLAIVDWPRAERWRHVALLRADRGDVQGATEAFERAARSWAPGLHDLARWRAARGDAEGALEAWRRVVALDPGDVDAWLRIAEATGDREALDEALRADPCSVDALLARAGPAGCEAIPWLERAFDAAPRDARVLDALGPAYHACGMDRLARGVPPAEPIDGLRALEWTWRLLGETGAADRAAAWRTGLESP